MGKGKICAQCAHASLGAYNKALKKSKEEVASWEWNGQAKICLKGKDENDLLELQQKAKKEGIVTFLVLDAGHTQVEE